MYSLAFGKRKWPKKHDFLVEELEPLNVRDVLGYLTAHRAQKLLSWSPPTHPHLYCSQEMRSGGPLVLPVSCLWETV